MMKREILNQNIWSIPFNGNIMNCITVIPTALTMINRNCLTSNKILQIWRKTWIEVNGYAFDVCNMLTYFVCECEIWIHISIEIFFELFSTIHTYGSNNRIEFVKMHCFHFKFSNRYWIDRMSSAKTQSKTRSIKTCDGIITSSFEYRRSR